MSTTPAPSPSIAVRCDDAIRRHRLLDHPFYQAWNDGTLPVRALADYAREYGAFITTVAAGWRAAGEPGIAAIEDEHAAVWNDTFAAALGTAIGAPEVPEVSALVATAEALFAERDTALGALYAFEAQQPATAASKLAGLLTHYRELPDGAGDYFRMHETDYDEPALLARALDDLDAPSGARALDACERMSRALYDALSGIHATCGGPVEARAS